MAHSARRPLIALTLALVLWLPATARASVVYDFVTTAYTGSIPEVDGLTDIRLTLSDAAYASGVVGFSQDAGLTPADPPTTVGSGVEQFSWWVGDRLPADASNFHFDATLAVQPDTSLSGDIVFAGLEDTLFLSYDAGAGLWRGSAFSDRPPVCSSDPFTCSFEGYFVLARTTASTVPMPEPGTPAMFAVGLVALGLALRRARLRKGDPETSAV